jgi:hypothetical protein
MKRALLLAGILAGGSTGLTTSCASGPSPTAQVATIDRQLDELYRPLAAMVEESRLSYVAFKKREGRQESLPTDRTLTDEEMKRWIDHIEKEIFPRNEKMCALIRSKRDLVVGGELPKSWQALLEHQDGWREDHDQWRKKGVAYPFHARTGFPRTLEREVKATIAELEERKAALFKN